METLTRVTDCPQATRLPPGRQLAPSPPGQKDSEREVDEECAAVSSAGPVSASFGSCWCNSEQQISAQTAAAIHSWRH